MRKLTLLLTCLLLVGIGLVNAQSKSITEMYFPQMMATYYWCDCQVKGTAVATSLTTDGKFRINLSASEKTLVISLCRMKTIYVEGVNNFGC